MKIGRMLDWQWPYLLLLFPLPWILRLLLSEAKHEQINVRIPNYEQLIHLQQSNVSRLRNAVSKPWLRASLTTLMWLALLTSAARPMWFGEPVSVSNSGRDLLLALDLSDSMKIDDMLDGDTRATRIQTIKQVAGEFIERRKGDRVGLIVFGQNSYLQSPLTFDRASVAIQLREALAGFAGSSTAIGDALGMGIKLLRDRPSEGRVLILLTDGANTIGSDPEEATAIAVEAGIRVHTIGVGASSLETTDVAGGKVVVDPSRDLDESVLQTIAASTGGRYFRAHDPAEMQSIYATIDELEPIPEEQSLRPQRSLYHWPLALALIFAMLALWLNFYGLSGKIECR